MDTNFSNIPAPAPAPAEANMNKAPENVFRAPEITSESIMELMSSRDENGHSPSDVFFTLERVKNVTPGKTYYEYSDDDKEFIDSISVRDCAVEMYSLNGALINLNLIFDTPQSAYLADCMDMLNRFRVAGEDLVVKGIEDQALVLTVTIAPDEMMGKGACVCTLPTMYTRCLADNGENTALFLQFFSQDVRFVCVEMTEEEEKEITADALRMEAAASEYNDAE